MVTVSHLTKKYVDDMPFLHEALGKRLLSYGAVAQMLKPRIEKELGKEVKLYAIVMALRRHGEDIVRRHESEHLRKIFERGSALSMKSGLCDITIRKSGTLFGKLKSIYDAIDYEEGEILNIIHGNLTVTIVFTENRKGKVMEAIGKETIVNIEDDLAQVSLKFQQDFLYTPGVLYLMNRELLWQNVNIIEIVSSLTEVNFIVKRKDAVKAYSALEEMLSVPKK